MRLVTLDWETYYDSEYTLKKMTTEEYINDPRFEIIGVSVKLDDAPAVWKTGSMERLRQLIGGAGWWEQVALCAHNTAFDAAILSWKFGIKPRFLFDTMSMARPFHSSNIGLSLEALAAHYGLGVKGKEVLEAKGKRLEDFTPEELAAYGEYCKNDVELTHKLLKVLAKKLPRSEIALIDRTLRMYTQPVLMLDESKIMQEEALEIARKQALLDKLGGMDGGALRSNDQFADLLRSLGVEPPTKDSPKQKNEDGTPKKVWAFAKGDADFVALKDHPNETVQAAVEARLGVKSTQRETRARRFHGIYRRNNGHLPVPLAYYAAHTGRYGGWDSINLQNLPRVSNKDPMSGLLRRAIIAPPGHALVVADLSQIEARMLVWQAGQQDKVDAFAQRRDIYSEQASVIYNRKVDRKKVKEDYTPGFIGKAVTLGCFTADTQVLTNHGWKPIICVTGMDLLWDGEEWVAHEGVIPQGEKEVVRAYGLAATPDHEILTEHGWREWSEVHTDSSLFRSAISVANSQSLPGGARHAATEQRGHGTRSSDAPAGQSGWWTAKTLLRENPRAATSARSSPPRAPGSATGATQTSSQTTRTASGCSTESRRSSLAAIRRAVRNCTTMADGVLRSLLNGAAGRQGAGNSLPTCSLSTDGTVQSLTSTGSTTMPDTSRAICGSSPSRKTSGTGEPSPRCSGKWMTYDIAFAGPRNRYTVATTAGPLIVHNCGYGMGPPKFCGMIYVGMLGEPGILFDTTFVDALGVDVATFEAWARANEERWGRYMAVKPAAIDVPTWIQHCAVGTKIILTYRKTNPMVVKYWDTASRMITAMANGDELCFGGPTGTLLRTVENGIVLPNGMVQRYEGLRKDKDGYSFLRRKEGRIQRVRVYGGALVENITQALARIVITDVMEHAERKFGYRTALQVHDEIIFVTEEDKAKEAFDNTIALMRTPPAWGDGLPLDAEGDFGKVYGDCK